MSMSASLSLRPRARLAPALRLAPGILASLGVGALGLVLGRWPAFVSHAVGALTLAVALGLVIGNTVYPVLAARLGPGVAFSRQTLLRAGVVFYGLRLSLHDIVRVGLGGVVIDALVVTSTFALACWLGIRVLRVERRTAMLIGAGSAICGAAAVMATEPVVRARSEEATVAVATVVVFGTLATFVYPLLYAVNVRWHVLPGGLAGFGVYAGSTIHEVAQVVAAARSVGPEAADIAVIAKMVRVMMLAPFLVALGMRLRRGPAPRPGEPAVTRGKLPGVPPFALAFLAVVLAHSACPLSPALNASLGDADTVLLAAAMGALGLSSSVRAIRQAGARPLLLAAALAVWLIVFGALLNRSIALLLG